MVGENDGWERNRKRKPGKVGPPRGETIWVRVSCVEFCFDWKDATLLLLLRRFHSPVFRLNQPPETGRQVRTVAIALGVF